MEVSSDAPLLPCMESQQYNDVGKARPFPEAARDVPEHPYKWLNTSFVLRMVIF
jgi:hypothetical protein